ncbi:3-phosphoshikimate 1-carboxyvinyltransferase [candidate division WOR-1 bacterium RIFOXYA12_FULL_43_27]|uniref:3-phosphoshikimate 1-carboxyvinyltransferase n=1 Tax=candidate division WOR-1 bacterium RIFOXYC2_FULL_46_14 TaxID=1802587 RepID=A0A1F4U700_UNCSA|nr:MAG: 3-phosphoshikimate 1-carboxyvinyltransferase [candidate division WOR-1 bacterium RIFOXYA12_FULL_43_27]OGC19145.1 MAG: 3-phosphoshikimate 1-carboxyvinyltransferase [candidate division WOR-1 bacterium RIFOXYB2_FULL_46_45]OGC30133.1 MAG: 3-phosphoshikimate 1-carboxyvinyltransferase [candidate division WOR-1 bacterium RIFOXYA2_FULL_46_56]OGC40735.1 MAG: 3-phosphoshikimate 1-carboxyvinyltransferase [candidate division WOR-1 bacterium RIFOXYC2_FULL_46_14]
MVDLVVKKADSLKGEISVPGDKSISHRAVMLGAIAEGETIIEGFLMGEDCLATVECFRQMGIDVQMTNDKCQMSNEGRIIIKGRGLKGLEKPNKPLYVGNSGTTIRLLSGILAGQDFDCEISGDASIQKRPMKRIIEPLSLMGAKISGNNDYPPLKIKGSKLKGIEYKMPIASAQVKSAILLAGLYAEGKTTVIEPVPSRDHTERMLKYFGGPPLQGGEISVPGDLSSAAFFIVAGLIVPNSNLLIRNVGLNPTRTGIIEVIHRMGGNLEIINEQLLSYEPRGDILLTVHSSQLTAIEIGGELIPRLIDEIPIIAVLATQANGKTVIRNAKELRVKESDRISTVSQELRKMGADIQETEDGMVITGPVKLNGAVVNSHGDHRVAMSLAIAGLVADGEMIIENTDCIDTSFPGFEELLKKLR